jgi:SAM-dependent methyltransferase
MSMLFAVGRSSLAHGARPADMPQMFDDLRHGAALAALIRAEGRAALLRSGVRSGLFAALREWTRADALAAARGLDAQLCAAWLTALEAHELVERRGEELRSAGLARWLAEGADADAACAALEQSAYAYAPVLSHLPELMQGAPRPQWGARGDALRTARASRLSERRALAALHRIPGAKKARRILDIGCGEGHFLARILARYRDALGTGVELDASVAERAQEALDAAHVQRRAEVRAGDFFAVELAHGFDLALLNNNLHYFAESRLPALFARIADHLAPGGLLAIQTPVLPDGAFARWLGARATLATFDLFLRAHENLAPLPDIARLDAALHATGFADVGYEPILPGGALRFVWARKGAATAERAPSAKPQLAK